MKNIKLTYIELNGQNSIVEVSMDYPKYEKSRICYLYELFYIDNIENIIKKQEEELLKYGVINGDLAPFFIMVDDNAYQQLKEYFTDTTEYENCKWNDEVSLLNAILGVYRNDPKNWE